MLNRNLKFFGVALVLSLALASCTGGGSALSVIGYGPETIVHYSWATATGTGSGTAATWRPRYKVEYSYDSAGRLAQAVGNDPFGTGETADDVQWDKSTKDEYSYDKNGNYISDVTYEYGGVWHPVSKFEFGYDDNGLVTSAVGYKYDYLNFSGARDEVSPDNWIPLFSVGIENDADNRYKQIDTFNYNGSSWDQDNRSKYTYLSAGELQSVSAYQNGGHSQARVSNLELIALIEFAYDEDDYLTETKVQNASEGSPPTPNSLIDWTYNGVKQLVKVDLFNWNESMDSHTYYAEHQLSDHASDTGPSMITCVTYSTDTQKWYNLSKMEIDYTNSGSSDFWQQAVGPGDGAFAISNNDGGMMRNAYQYMYDGNPNRFVEDK